jgi:aminotransferase
MGHDAPMTTTKQPTTMTTTHTPASRVSRKAASFTESVIREMTRIALEHNAVNLAQGFPDFACPT